VKVYINCKNLVTSGLELATVWLVALCLNHYADHMGHCRKSHMIFFNIIVLWLI
jgi:hypothetical protein